ncbi:Aste57867_17025 [Aphanomyces stellatus]|uniref:Aste57867_17025 protein n=1 Tax=Aphanomyces stellatus TaxID=120398 RepID=A0A485L7Z4_9STRA|nr:hypothetical protein As57867_016967 [Aphanomyces stellatus]VFT93786.1 Aste57867_17025 [Aphanomyces stellatus]
MKKRSMRAWRRVYFEAGRLLASGAALFVFYCEVTGSQATRTLLVGLLTASAATNTYSSLQITQLLATIVKDPTAMATTLRAMAPSSGTPFVAYLDVNSTTNQVGLQPTACTTPSDADRLYEIAFVQPLLATALGHLNLSETFVIVDCSFDGRVSADASTLKVFIVDDQLENFTSFFIQTVSVTLPAQHRTTTGGAATMTTTPLASMQLSEDGTSVTSSHVATYQVAVCLTFPYENNAWEAVTLDAIVPPTGQWHATVDATGEWFSFAGTEGIYRGSIDIQASFDYYYWALPADPIAYASSIEYFDAHVFKDSWGWFRCFIGLGISFNIGVNAVVALLVMLNLWLHDGLVWLPDLYPAIQRRALLRAILLLADAVMGNWWYAYQYAVNQGNYRTALVGTLYLEETTRDDGLMVCLAAVYIVADALRLRLQLAVVALAYMLCFSYRLELVNGIGFFASVSNAYLAARFDENLIAGNGGMDLWTAHENIETNYTLILTECTWLAVAIGIGVAFALGVAVVVAIDSRVRGTRHVVASRRHSSVSSFELMTISTFPFCWRHPTPYPKHHWSNRSTLYDELSPTDMENTSVERSCGRIAAQVYGFVAPHKDYELRDGTLFVSRSGVWLLGFVVVDNRYLVGIGQYLFLVLNVLVQYPLVQIYAFALDDDVVSKRKQRLFYYNLTRRSVWRVTLRPLR